MEIIREWGDHQIRQRDDGCFLADDIFKVCEIKNNPCGDDYWLKPSVAQGIANKCGKFSFAAEIEVYAYNISWQIDKKELKYPLEQTGITNEKPKTLLGSNDFYVLFEAIKCLEKTQLPEDMELAKLLRANLRSKI